MPDWMGDGDVAFPFLGIYIENLPKTFSVFGITIALYGVLIGIGMILAFVLVTHVAKKNDMNPDDFYDMGLWLIIIGILGARIYYVIFSWDYYKNNISEVFNIRQGGLAIYGGVIAGFLTLIAWCKIKKKSICKMGDVAFMGVLVGQILGRWGNFTNREVFGGYCENIFAMRLPVNAVRGRDISEELASHIAEGTNYIQVHPTFLYESVYNLILLSLIYVFFKKKAFDGEGILWYFGGYGIGRFIIEGIRTDRLLIPGTNLAVSQVLGISLFVISVAIDIFVRVKMSSGKAKTE